MYSNKEISKIHEQFWATFGLYMAPLLSFFDEKINWVNYKTGVRDIRIVMFTENKAVKIALLLLHKDKALQQFYFEKLVSLQEIFEHIAGQDWEWHLHRTDQKGNTISEIAATLESVDVLNKSDWPDIITFLKSHIILLDQFWCIYKYRLE